MQSRHHNARPVVLRELSLLRALGASLRTASRPGKLRRPTLPLAVLPKPDPAALLPHAGIAPLVSDKRP